MHSHWQHSKHSPPRVHPQLCTDCVLSVSEMMPALWLSTHLVGIRQQHPLLRGPVCTAVHNSPGERHQVFQHGGSR